MFTAREFTHVHVLRSRALQSSICANKQVGRYYSKAYVSEMMFENPRKLASARHYKVARSLTRLVGRYPDNASKYGTSVALESLYFIYLVII